MTLRAGFARTRLGDPPAPEGDASKVGHRTRIDRPTTGLVARGLWLAIVSLSLAEAGMIIATRGAPTPDQWGFRGNEGLLALAWGSIGALIAVRQPGNRIGWLLLALSLVNAVQGVVDQYPAFASVSALGLPDGASVRWVSAWIWVIPSTGFLAFVPLIFPDGRLLSPRWRAAVLLGSAAMAVLVAGIVVSIRPLGPHAPAADPNPYLRAMGPMTAAGFALYLAAATTSAGCLVLRYRRAWAEEREQLKWVAYALVFVAIGAVLGTTPMFLGQLFLVAATLLMAAAVGIAILRYRLYEIDLIINRTLVYGALSAILAGVYTASITLSQRLFMSVTGERSDAAIVLTTLLLTASFTPVKTRLQSIVDRRVKPPSRAAFGTPDHVAVAAILGTVEQRLREIAREEIAASSRSDRTSRGRVADGDGHAVSDR